MKITNAVYSTPSDAFIGLFFDSGLSQAEFAARIGVSRSLVSRVLRRQRVPSWSLLERLQSIYCFQITVCIEDSNL